MTTGSGPGHGRPGPGLDAITSQRRRLVNLAYRLLGSLAEAEDAVQETYARWYAMPAAKDRRAFKKANSGTPKTVHIGVFGTPDGTVGPGGLGAWPSGSTWALNEALAGPPGEDGAR